MQPNMNNGWPELEFEQYQETLETLHQWFQIVGKVRLKTMPWQNHSWHTTLYVSSTGFSTHGIPYEGRIFEIDFDFKRHKLLIQCSNAAPLTMDLKPRTVASFYEELMEKLNSIGVTPKLHARPNEMEPAIPFAKNTEHTDYDPEMATALWQAMLKVNGVFNQFRTEFVGKASPVHLFWGAFDLAVTRFSGHGAPEHPGGMPNMPLEVMQEAYSQEVSSAGFWPGSKDSPMPVFYAYSYPTGEGFGEQKVLPSETFYSPEMGEFFLKYEDVIKSDDPEKTLHDFLQTTYEAAVNTSNWDREKLEKS
ncbi:MAG: DUF5996 family protein [Cytophagales bacterium]|nr:DUF5996 family protein [Cytophagales bacterium]